MYTCIYPFFSTTVLKFRRQQVLQVCNVRMIEIDSKVWRGEGKTHLCSSSIGWLWKFEYWRSVFKRLNIRKSIPRKSAPILQHHHGSEGHAGHLPILLLPPLQPAHGRHVARQVAIHQTGRRATYFPDIQTFRDSNSKISTQIHLFMGRHKNAKRHMHIYTQSLNMDVWTVVM